MSSKGVGISNIAGAVFQTIYFGTAQELTVTSTPAQSAAVGDNVNVIQFFPTVDCYIKVGVNPTATAALPSVWRPGGILQHMGITPGHKISVIKTSYDTGGTFYIVEGSAS